MSSAAGGFGGEMSVSRSQDLRGQRGLGSESLRSPEHNRRAVFGGFPRSGAALSEVEVGKGVRRPAALLALPAPPILPASPSTSLSPQRPSFPTLYAHGSSTLKVIPGGSVSPAPAGSPVTGLLSPDARLCLQSLCPVLSPSVALGSARRVSDRATLED